MLNFLKRSRRPVPAPADADPLAIRNLLDDPRLQALIDNGTDAPATSRRRRRDGGDSEFGTAA